MDVQLLQDVGAVGFHRRRADRQEIGDLLVAVSLGDELEDLALALRQRFVPITMPLSARWRT